MVFSQQRNPAQAAVAADDGTAAFESNTIATARQMDVRQLLLVGPGGRGWIEFCRPGARTSSTFARALP